MKKSLALIVMLPVITGCTSLNSGASEFLRAITTDGNLNAAITVKDFAPSSATRFTVQCPYGLIETVEKDLGLHSNVIPDYSAVEDLNAIIVSDGRDVISVLEFERTDLDLCPPEVSWHALQIGHPLRFRENPDGGLTVEADDFIARQE